MNKIIVLTFFLCLTISAFSQLNEITYFHRSNGNIIDPNGNCFMIKATNVSCWLYQENYILGGAQNAQAIFRNR
jgi:hypothetical protein